MPAPPQDGETLLRTIYARYVRWCGEPMPPAGPLAADAFAGEFRLLCDRARIATDKRRDGAVVCFGVRLVDVSASQTMKLAPNGYTVWRDNLDEKRRP